MGAAQDEGDGEAKWVGMNGCRKLFCEALSGEEARATSRAEPRRWEVQEVKERGRGRQECVQGFLEHLGSTPGRPAEQGQGLER